MINWDKLLLEIESRIDTTSLSELAKEYGVHRVTLTNRWKGFQSGKKFSDNLDYDSNMARRELNIKKEQRKLAQQRLEMNRQLRGLAFYENFINDYVVPNVKPLKEENKNISNPNKKNNFLLLTDLHYIDQKRSEKDVKKIKRMIIDNFSNGETINIIFMGDLIEGAKHISTQISKTSSVMDQITQVSDLISRSIISASNKLNKSKINLYFLKGNHEYGNFVGSYNREDPQENFVYLIRELIKKHLKGTSIQIKKQESLDDLVIGNKHFQHGDRVKSDFKTHMKTRREQQSEMFKGVNYFFKGHSHKQEYIVPKGEDLHFINVPCLKTWTNDWEIDNNQIGTNGAVIIKGDDISFIK